MVRVDNVKNVQNVYTLNFDNVRPALAKLEKQKKTRRLKTVPSYDNSEAINAGQAVALRFRKFLMDTDESELFGFVLDGKTSDERSESQEAIMEKLLGFLRGSSESATNHIQQAKFKAADFENDDTKEIPLLHALSVTTEDGETTIYLSTELGFKDSLLAAHIAYSDFTTIVAKSLGVDLLPGDVALHISELVSSGSLPEGLLIDEGPQPIKTVVAGEILIGIPR